MEQFHSSNDNNILNCVITVPEVYDMVKKLKNNKSTGLETIPNEVLRLPGILHALTALFNNCFTHSYVPDLWLKSLITPVPKGKDKDPNVPLN